MNFVLKFQLEGRIIKTLLQCQVFYFFQYIIISYGTERTTLIILFLFFIVMNTSAASGGSLILLSSIFVIRSALLCSIQLMGQNVSQVDNHLQLYSHGDSFAKEILFIHSLTQTQNFSVFVTSLTEIKSAPTRVCRLSQRLTYASNSLKPRFLLNILLKHFHKKSLRQFLQKILGGSNKYFERVV